MLLIRMCAKRSPFPTTNVKNYYKDKIKYWKSTIYENVKNDVTIYFIHFYYSIFINNREKYTQLIDNQININYFSKKKRRKRRTAK